MEYESRLGHRMRCKNWLGFWGFHSQLEKKSFVYIFEFEPIRIEHSLTRFRAQFYLEFWTNQNSALLTRARSVLILFRILNQSEFSIRWPARELSFVYNFKPIRIQHCWPAHAQFWFCLEYWTNQNSAWLTSARSVLILFGILNLNQSELSIVDPRAQFWFCLQF